MAIVLAMRFSTPKCVRRCVPKSKKARVAVIVFGGAFCVSAVFLRVHNVPVDPTEEDIAAIKIMMGENVRTTRPENYADQIAYIRQAQAAVASVAEKQTPIPYKQTREPADLVREKRGLCYDRSRTLEKILRVAGFKARHVALYTLPSECPTPTKIWRLATDRTLKSHAVTECLTDEGWLLVDSLHSWLSVDQADRPVALADWNQHSSQWRAPPPEDIYQHPFTAVYGLYSRHGAFYPPYTPIPDINWREFIHNAGRARGGSN
ncbi:MAG: transglutaminase domain-containing protein [Lentisphaeria bacterium]|nr:transglutaminase domain-containing protein [Lentisphaeria bacterium]